MNGCSSRKIQNDLGVPPGSVLGAILFILYINDMPSQLKDAFINLFVDDTLIYLHGKNLDIMRDRLNVELQKISQWLRLNKLKLNVSKTKMMVIRGSSTLTSMNCVMIDEEVIEMEHEFKY